MPARCLGLLGIIFVATVAANAQTARVYVSSEAGDRLAAKPEVRFTDKKPPAGPTFEINEAVRFQKIDGFGASFMEAGLMTLNTLPRDKQEEVLRALFDPNEGANPDPNIQHPVVIINKTTHEITYTGTYYYLAHFSKFVRPGTIRVQTTGRAQGLRVMSFLTPDGGI